MLYIEEDCNFVGFIKSLSLAWAPQRAVIRGDSCSNLHRPIFSRCWAGAQSRDEIQNRILPQISGSTYLALCSMLSNCKVILQCRRCKQLFLANNNCITRYEVFNNSIEYIYITVSGWEMTVKKFSVVIKLRISKTIFVNTLRPQQDIHTI